MEPTTEATEAERRLAASLTAPASPLPSLPNSPPSEAANLLSLMNVLVTRVDQLAKATEEQYARQERVNVETVATMTLAREMIGQMAQQYDQMTDLILRMETAVAALVRVNGNLTEIVAALVAPTPQKG